jgi:hypothetical protein
MNLNRKLLPEAVRLLAILCTVVLLPGESLADLSYLPFAQASSPQDQPSKIPPDQLDSLVAQLQFIRNQKNTQHNA